MKNNKNNIPPIVELKYKKGDLILKEGDYGISIYEIIKGSVNVFTQEGDSIVNLSKLEHGEIFGEMTFLTGSTEPRAASVRALEDTVLNVWHPRKLTTEFGEMPPVLKLMVEQTLKRLVRVNRLIADLNARRQQTGDAVTKGKEDNLRRHFRKETEIPCIYRSAKARSLKRLKGVIKDLSKTGAKLEIEAANFKIISHLPGDFFIIKMTLPPEKELDLTAQLIHIRRKGDDNLTIGLAFHRLTEDDQKTLGFYLLQYYQPKSGQSRPTSFWP